MPDHSRAVDHVDPLLSLVAPERRRFLKQLLVGTGVLAFLGAPASHAVVEAQEPASGKGKKGKGKSKKGKGKSTKGKGRSSKGKAKGKGKGTA